ncbi:MAG: penicillin-binding protein activator [Candidatus ainarchaeum sp.]|nr:penicillin-binding protein activator [Candidatus ainarchaeum sp.]
MAFFIFLGCISNAPSDQEKIKIGVIIPLTGDAAMWGKNAKNGIELAYDNLDSETKNKIQLIFEDDQCNGQAGVTAANKLITIDKAKFIVGTVCSSVTLSIAPITESNKALLFSSCSSNPKITNAGDFVFRNFVSDIYEGSVIAEHAKSSFSLNKIAVIYLNNDYCTGLKDVFKKKFESLGGTIITIESFEQNSKDFRTQLSKIKAADPDGIYVDSNPEEQPIILNQIKELGIEKIILANSASTEGNDALFTVSKGASEGVMFVSLAWKDPDWFVEQYKNKYAETPGICSDTTYDALNLVVDAIKQCGKDTACVKDKLYEVKDYNGVAGITTFDQYGDIAEKPYVLKTIKNGKFVEYKK